MKSVATYVFSPLAPALPIPFFAASASSSPSFLDRRFRAPFGDAASGCEGPCLEPDRSQRDVARGAVSAAGKATV